MRLAHLPPILFIIGFLFSCNKHKNIQSHEISSVLNTNELGGYEKRGNILISANFDECGEWGGHSEKLIIYADSNMAAHARYTVYPFECDSIPYYHDRRNLQPKLDTTILLSSQKQKAISSYIGRLAQAKMAERFPGHAGKTFTVSKFDSTLIIQVYDSNQKNSDSYKQLLSELL